MLVPKDPPRFSGFGVRSLVALLLAGALLSPLPLRAYHKRLSQEEVTEAYYLGQRRDAQLAEFFNRYQWNFRGPRQAGDYISAVVIRTPYALAVLRSASFIGHYTAQNAWQDYQAAPDELEVVAYLDYSFGNKSAPPSDPPVTRDAVRGYYVKVKQRRHNEEHTLVARDARLERGLLGALPESLQIHATFRVQDIESSDITVEVTIPSGRRVAVNCNLRELR